ncbi:MAG TPA: hypothetical protein VIW24_30780 [Aldersonia sp.]
MHREFYAALAKVLPVLLLALAWESSYREKLKRRANIGRSELFWTVRRVRGFSFALTAMLVAGIYLSISVLADTWPSDALWVRLLLMAFLICTLTTLFVRIGADTVEATTEGP